MVECRVCKSRLPPVEFYRSSGKRCRKCTVEQTNKWREANRETVNRRSRERSRARRTNRRCRVCNEVLPVENFLSRGFTCGLCRQAKEQIEVQRKMAIQERRPRPPSDKNDKRNEYARQRSASIKRETIDRYGGECACCGEKELVFLAIDHIYGGGRKDRLEKNWKTGAMFYGALRRAGYPDAYQVLCFNCNWAKSHGGCPHGNAAGQPKALPA